MMVKVTKIVAKSLASLMDKPSAPLERLSQMERSTKEKLPLEGSPSGLDQLFKIHENKKNKKKIEKVEFSDRLGAVFGVTEPRPLEEQDG